MARKRKAPTRVVKGRRKAARVAQPRPVKAAKPEARQKSSKRPAKVVEAAPAGRRRKRPVAPASSAPTTLAPQTNEKLLQDPPDINAIREMRYWGVMARPEILKQLERLNVHAISSRVKDPKRIETKITRKRIEKASEERRRAKFEKREEQPVLYGLESITDIVGVRIVTLYKEEIPNIVKAVLSVLMQEGADGTFYRSDLKEFKYFSSATETDAENMAAALRDVANQAGCPKKFETERRKTYSGVHFVTYFRVEVDNEPRRVPVEIQVRSTFEDAWAEVDHKLNYELERVGRGAPLVGRHMTVLKNIMDAAAAYADTLRATANAERVAPVTIVRTLGAAVDNDIKYVDWLCRERQVPPELHNAFIDALEKKAELDSVLDSRTPSLRVSSVDYLQCAGIFGALHERVVAAQYAGEEDLQEFRFLVRMEEAVCRLLSSDPTQIREARAIYSSMAFGDFKEFPTVWFRLGQTYGRLASEEHEDSDEARAAVKNGDEAYGKAEEKLAAAAKRTKKARRLLVSQEQETYLRENTARLRSFMIWRLAYRRKRKCGATIEDLKEMLSAYHIIAHALENEAALGDKAAASLRNNIASFAAHALEVKQELEKARAKGLADVLQILPPVEEINAHLDWIAEYAARDEIKDNVKEVLVWDSIAHGRAMLKNPAAADAARRVLDLFEAGENDADAKPRSAYELEAQDRALRRAWGLVKTKIKSGADRSDR